MCIRDSYHIESIEEKELPIDPINAYNHMAIYLRWCMEHDLMGDEFLEEYGDVVQKVKADPAGVDLRAFIPVSYTHLDVYKRQAERNWTICSRNGRWNRTRRR